MAKKDRDAAGSSEDGVRSRRSVQFKTDLGTEDAAAYLEALAVALRDGRLLVQAARESIDVPVASRVRLDVEAKSSRGARKSSVELRLNWPKRPEAPEQSVSSVGASATVGAADNVDVAPAEEKSPSKAADPTSDQADPESASPASSPIAAPDSE
jgi:amphi-Trp domain-containing protein